MEGGHSALPALCAVGLGPCPVVIVLGRCHCCHLSGNMGYQDGEGPGPGGAKGLEVPELLGSWGRSRREEVIPKVVPMAVQRAPSGASAGEVSGVQEGGQQALCALCAQNQSPSWIPFRGIHPPACAPVSQAPFTVCQCAPPADICGAREHPADARLVSLVGPACIQLLAPHLLQQRQLGEELVGAVFGQEVGPLLAGLGVGAAEVLEEAGLGQGGRDGVLALLVVWQCQPVAPGQPPGEALQRGAQGWERAQAQDPSAWLS